MRNGEHDETVRRPIKKERRMDKANSLPSLPDPFRKPDCLDPIVRLLQTGFDLVEVNGARVTKEGLGAIICEVDRLRREAGDHE
jgi:hypothetical protein